MRSTARCGGKSCRSTSGPARRGLNMGTKAARKSLSAQLQGFSGAIFRRSAPIRGGFPSASPCVVRGVLVCETGGVKCVWKFWSRYSAGRKTGFRQQNGRGRVRGHPWRMARWTARSSVTTPWLTGCPCFHPADASARERQTRVPPCPSAGGRTAGVQFQAACATGLPTAVGSSRFTPLTIARMDAVTMLVSMPTP